MSLRQDGLGSPPQAGGLPHFTMRATRVEVPVNLFWQDLKYVLRGLIRKPGVPAAVVFALALGIGANTVIFSALNAVLLNPLAFRYWKQPERVVMLWEKNPSLSLFFANRMLPRMSNFRAWKERSRSFEDLAFWSDVSLTLTAGDRRVGLQPEQVEAGAASANLFPLLGVPVEMGRGFTAADMEPGSRRVALLSDELFRSRYGADPQVLGKTLIANDEPYRIIGVLPAGFMMPAVWQGFDQKKPRLWIPGNLHPPEAEDNAFQSYVFGRLKASVAAGQARAEMEAIGRALSQEKRDNVGFGVNVTGAGDEDVGPELRRTLLVLQVAVLFVLLIACANAGNLLLARAAAREKEIAVRLAVGAGRSGIIRLTLLESLVLSLIASAAALLLSQWALQGLSYLAPQDAHGLHELRIDGTVVLFTAGVALMAAALFGLAPALYASGRNVSQILGRTSRGVSGASLRLRNVLVTAEIALSLVLLVGAGLMIRTLLVLTGADLGFRPDHLLVMSVALPDTKYKQWEQVMEFNNRLLEGARRVAGVESAALTNGLPMKSVNQSSFDLPGRTFKPGSFPVSNWARVSDGYFETLGIRVLRGHTFSRADVLADAPNVAVVNQAFVRTYFPNQDPIGKTIGFGNEKGAKTQYTIAGVVADESQLGPDGERSPEVYLPSNRLRTLILVARTSGDPLRLAAAFKQKVWDIDRDQPLAQVGTEEEALRSWLAPRRFNMLVLVSFAGVAIVLAAVGLYSVLAYSVTLRTREIGIRMALGAEPQAVAGFLMRQGLALAALGMGIGLVGAVALTRYMRSLLFGVSTLDVPAFAAMVLLLAGIAAAATFLPAWRAARIDPVEALRVE